MCSNSGGRTEVNLVEQILEQGQRLRNAMVQSILSHDPLYNHFTTRPSCNLKMHSICMDEERAKRELDKYTICMDEENSKRELTTAEKHKFVAYLRGDDMSTRDEKQALETFRAMSNADICEVTQRSYSSLQSRCDCDTCKAYHQSLQVFRTEVPPLNLKSSRNNSAVRQDYNLNSSIREDSSVPNYDGDHPFRYLKYVDTLKIAVHSLTLNHEGNVKVSSSFTNKKNARLSEKLATTYFIEYEIPSVIVRSVTKKAKVDTGLEASNVVKLCSKKLHNEAIYFKQISLHDVANLDRIDLENVEIRFTVSCRSLKQKGVNVIGHARFNMGSFSDTKYLSCNQELVVVLKESTPVVLGTIKIGLQLGAGRLYFGKEFLDSVSNNKENNIILPEVVSDDKIEGADNDSFQDVPCRDINPHEVIQKERKIKERATQSRENEILTLRSNKEPAKICKRKNKEIVQIKDLKEADIQLEDPSIRIVNRTILFGFIYVSEVEYLDTKESTYFTCQPFCQNDLINSSAVNGGSNPIFNFQQKIPIIYEEDFISRLRDNFMVFEFWEKRSYRDELIGVCSIPLHQYYLAFRNPVIVNYLNRNKLPVISTDWYEPISHPTTGTINGQALILIALGSEAQIQNLETERGFKDNIVTRAKRSIITKRPLINEPLPIPKKERVTFKNLRDTLNSARNILERNNLLDETWLVNSAEKLEDLRSIDDPEVSTKSKGIVDNENAKRYINEREDLRRSYDVVITTKGNVDIEYLRRNKDKIEGFGNIGSSVVPSKDTVDSLNLDNIAGDNVNIQKKFGAAVNFDAHNFSRNSQTDTVDINFDSNKVCTKNFGTNTDINTDRCFGVGNINKNSDALNFNTNVDKSSLDAAILNKNSSDAIKNQLIAKKKETITKYSSDELETCDKSTSKVETVDKASQSEPNLMDNQRSAALETLLQQFIAARPQQHETRTSTEYQLDNMKSPESQVFNESRTNTNINKQSAQSDVRKTIDLLDTLNRALSVDCGPCVENFKAHIVVESALHLPTRAKCKAKKMKGKYVMEKILPSTYVTFEVEKDGELKSTQVVQRSSSPKWDFRCDVSLPVDLLVNNQKRLIFKVWKKANNASMQPNMQVDTVLGFAALDLTVLLAGLPTVQGWFNIIDFSSKCNGQIKINVTPLENISKYNLHKNNSNQNSKLEETTTPTTDSQDEPGELLSRALKRKFIELDEITQRLRSRLSTVTNDESDTSNDDVADEFEKDINTLCVEDDYDMVNFVKEAQNLNMQQVSNSLLKWQGVPQPDNQTLLVYTGDEEEEEEFTNPLLMLLKSNAQSGNFNTLMLNTGDATLQNTDCNTSLASCSKSVTESTSATSVGHLDQQLVEGKNRIDTLLQKLSLISKDSEPFSSRYVSGCSMSQETSKTSTEDILQELGIKNSKTIPGLQGSSTNAELQDTSNENILPDLSMRNSKIGNKINTEDAILQELGIKHDFDANRLFDATLLKEGLNSSSSTSLNSIITPTDNKRDAPDGEGNTSGEKRGGN